VIIGKLIPAGSGFVKRRREQIACQQQAAAQLAPAPVGAMVGATVASTSTGVGTLDMVLDNSDNE